MASLQTPQEQVVGPAGIAVYASLATLALEQNRVYSTTIVATLSPFAFYQAVQTNPGVGQYAATSTAAVAQGGGVTYWVPVTLGAGGVGVQGVGQVRAVVTAISTMLAAAYTGSLTGTLTQATATAIAAQDGVTLAVGDVVLVPGATVGASAGNIVNAADAGPWVVSVIGTASVKGVLTRPLWWTPGMVLNGQSITVSEGTIFAGSQWKSFAVKGSAVDVTAVDPALYPNSVTQAATLVTGFVTVKNVPILSLTTTQIAWQPTNFNGGSLTVHYATGAISSGGAATAIGPMQTTGNTGSASASITALIAAGTFNTNDIGTGLFTISNW